MVFSMFGENMRNFGEIFGGVYKMEILTNEQAITLSFSK